MKKRTLSLLILVFALCHSVSAITLNNVAYTIDTLAQFSPGPGAMFYQLRMLREKDKGNRLDCWLMTVDTKNPYVSIEAVMGRDAVIGTERPSAMAIRKTTPTKIFYGGTNGDFFATAGDIGRPTGLSIVNNEFVYTPTSATRRFGGVAEDMRAVVGTTMKYSGKLILPDTTLTIKHVNYTRAENQLVLYNQHNGATTLTNAYGTELLIELLPGYAWHTTTTVKAKVLTKQVGVGSMPIPAGKAVLSGHGTMQTMLNAVSEGDTVTIKLALKIDGTNMNVAQCIGGDNYALIVDSGRVEQSNFWNELHPRTAYGSNQTGDTLLFLVVDGRGVSVGCTTKVLGEIIHYYGAWKAVNWDGGGSSCLYLRHFGEVNKGSDGWERAVGNAMFAVANIPEPDTTIAIITPYITTYTLPRYGLAKPDFLGYNKYGVLLNTHVQGITLSCDPSVGEILPDGRFMASGTTDGLLHAALNDSVSCDLHVRFATSAPVAFRLDSIVMDNRTPYTVEIISLIGKDTIRLLPSALNWRSLDETVARVSDSGLITALTNGSALVIGSLGDFADTLLVNVQIPQYSTLAWEDFCGLDADWTLTATSGFNPFMGMLTQDEPIVTLGFNYVIGRSPFIKMENKKLMYGRPDSICWDFSTDALFSKIQFVVRPCNSSLNQVVQLFGTGVPQNVLNHVCIPVSETFGADEAIFPLELQYINFLVDTKTTTGDHRVQLQPIRLIYNGYPAPESALSAQTADDAAVRKILKDGRVIIIRNHQCYSVLGTALTSEY